jgi:hypothetical protein
MATFNNVQLSPAISIAREPVRRQFQEEPSPITIRPMANIDNWERGVSLHIGLKFILVQAMMIWTFQLAFTISIEWRVLSVNSSNDEEEAEDHYDSDNGLSLEEREYRRQRDEQDTLHNTPANRAAVRENNCRRFQERRRQREAEEILPVYKRHDNNNTPSNYDDETTSRRSTPIPLTGNETWGDLNDAATITRLMVQQRADALALALVDSYRQHWSLPRTQSWEQWQELCKRWYHINGYTYMDTVPRHILTPMYTAAPNAQLLTETVPAEYICETRAQTPGEENDPNF